MKFELNKTPRSIKAASEKSAALKIVLMDESEAGAPEVLIMDRIGADFFAEGVTAANVIEFLGKHDGKDVTARINTFGGDAYEGIAIHNALSAHSGQVTALVEGIAFSAGSILAMGADRIVMKAASDFGIHHANTVAGGNAKMLAGAIEWLNAVDAHQVAIFANKTGKSESQIKEWLAGTDDGTIFNASEALEHGFADEVIPLKSKEPAKAETKFSSGLFAAQMRHRLALAGCTRRN